MEIKLYKQDGTHTGTVSLSDELFGGPVNTALLHQVVSGFLANRRQGTAKTKGRSEVSGGGRKPWRQKGTGRARAGSNTSPLWVRGGTIFGPVPRNYGSTIPKQMRMLALRSAITSRARDNKIIAVESISCEVPKTKTLTAMLKVLPVTGGGKVLLVTESVHRSLYLSGRNIKGLRVTPVTSLNALDILSHEHIILGARAVAGTLEKAVTL